MGGGGGGGDGEGGGGEGDGGGGDGDGGGGDGDGGGGDGGVGGGGEGGKYSRGPQSSQSVPRSHWAPSAPSCPSWQWSLSMNCAPPLPKEFRQVFSQVIGGDPGGEGSNVTVPTQLALAAARAATQKRRSHRPAGCGPSGSRPACVERGGV
eukprot:scaffold88486_cov47-Phaeocystis_antarctica.AAC.2